MSYTRSQKRRFDSIVEESTAKFLTNIKLELADQKALSSTLIEKEVATNSASQQETNEPNKLEKCAICLQKFSFKSKSYASTCFHSYCFECLLEWTKIRYSCPLCKQSFDRIIYDVKSNVEYKEYFLKPKANETLNNPLEIIAYLPPPSHANLYNTNANHNYLNEAPPIRSKASWFINREQLPIEFRMLVYKNG